MSRVRVLALVLGAAALGVAGCGGSGGQAPRADPPALAAVPTVTEPGQVTFPTDAYLVTPEQIREIVRGQDAVAAQCMGEYGFAGRPTGLVGLDDMVGERTTRSLVYGYFDVAGAATKGYANTAVQGPPEAQAGAGPMSEQEQTALTGADPRTGQPVTTLAGKPLPKGGCLQRARDVLGGPVPNPTSGDLPDGGPKVPVSDPRLVEAFAKWSACMKEKGFDYKEPVNAIGDPAWRQQAQGPSPQEIATATADVACKVANNTVGVVVAVQTAYDKQYIEANATKLADYRKRIDDMLRKAAQLTASSGSTG